MTGNAQEQIDGLAQAFRAHEEFDIANLAEAFESR